MSAPLRIIAYGTLAEVFAQVRARIETQRAANTMSADEARGGRWAITTAEAIAANEAEINDFIHDETYGSSRGG